MALAFNGGNTSFAATLSASPTAPRTITIPDATFTLAAVDAPQTFTAAQRGTVAVLAYAATITPDLSLANNFSIALTGNMVLGNPINLVPGQSGVITITQDATGSRTLAFGSIYDFTAGSPISLTSNAGARDHIAYYVDLNLNVVLKALGDAR